MRAACTVRGTISRTSQSRVAMLLLTIILVPAGLPLMGRARGAVVDGGSERSPPPEYRTVSVESGPFSVAIPNAWTALELSQSTPADADAGFAGQVADAREVPYAIFFAAAPDQRDSLVVQLFPHMRSLDWGPVRRQLRREHFRHLTPRRSRVAGEPAIVVNLELHGVVDQTFITFHFVLGERGVLGFAFVTHRDARRQQVYRPMIRSVELFDRVPGRTVDQAARVTRETRPPG